MRRPTRPPRLAATGWRLARALRAAVFAVAAGLAAPALADAGRFHLVAGDVTVVRDGAAGTPQSRRPVSGDTVATGDRIDTGTDGRAQVFFSDGSIVSIQPGSRFSIDSYRFDAGAQRGVFSLIRGSMRTLTGAIGKRDRDDYKLITPTATVGVRGTEFVAEQTVCDPRCAPGRTAGLRLAVSEGRVIVANAAGETEVAAGGAVYVPAADRPPEPTTERPVLSPTSLRGDGTAPDPLARAARNGAGSTDTSRRRIPTSEARAAERPTRFAILPADRRVFELDTPQRPEGTTLSEGSLGTGRIVSSSQPPVSRDALRRDDSATWAFLVRSDGVGTHEPASPPPQAISPNAARTEDGGLAAVPMRTPDAKPGGAGGAGDGTTGGDPPAGTEAAGAADRGSSDATPPASGSTTGPPPERAGNPPPGPPPAAAPPGSGGDAPGDPGPPPLQLSSGRFDGRHLFVTLRQSPVGETGLLSASRARVGLDADIRLQSIGLCPDAPCLSRGTASSAESGSDTIVAWGRWIDGSARSSVGGATLEHPLSADGGMHYLIGIPTLSMPTQGMASYALGGGTQPTFSNGSRSPGLLSANAVVQFATGRDTRVALDGSVAFADDTRYRFSTTGGLADPAATNMTMTGTNTFRGTLSVLADDARNALGCGGGQTCQAAVSGGFIGPGAAKLGLGFTLSGPGATGPTINGVGFLRRNW